MTRNTPANHTQFNRNALKLPRNAIASLYNCLPYKRFKRFLPGKVAIGNRTNQDFKAVRTLNPNGFASVSFLIEPVELTPVR